jgi:hypothetical protein
VNSLRLTGNSSPILVFDAGLTSDQRDALATVAEVRRLSISGAYVLPAFRKPQLLSGLEGPLVFLDSDMIVTASLEPAATAAVAGLICVLPDGPPRLQCRRFADAWTRTLGLQHPLRTQPYINSGFIALDASRWTALVDRWAELCAHVGESRSQLPHSIPMEVADAHPFAYLDQDVLNAVLMSEVDESAVCVLDWRSAGVPEPEDGTRVIDRVSLRCESDGRPTMLLHHLVHPKPWFPEARGCLAYEPYDELLVRLLSGPDLTIVPPVDAVPAWLRPGPVRRMQRIVARGQTMPARLLGHAIRLTKARVTLSILFG